MIGFFGSVTFKTSDKRICTFNNLKRTISGSYSEHKRYTKKSQREFAGHGVKPLAMLNKIIKLCENGTVCTFVLGGHKVGGGQWTIDSVDADYRQVWNHGELVSLAVNVTATEYH